MEIYKEFFLYVGEEDMEPFLAELKEDKQKELREYFKTVDPKKMKQIQGDDGDM